MMRCLLIKLINGAQLSVRDSISTIVAIRCLIIFLNMELQVTTVGWLE